MEEILPERTPEVSSPGMDRLLFKSEHYLAHVGERVDVALNYPFEGEKNLVGLLAGLEDDSVVLQLDDEEYLLPLENVQRHESCLCLIEEGLAHEQRNTLGDRIRISRERRDKGCDLWRHGGRLGHGNKEKIR